ncbi:hypothetical protein FOCG_10017 [Fusarium oxysporum f. sp. radicis-lycopersici 26381]|nr:hypothetical protein FOCG_10017 [Fusarium oxysporum f. sp. radicis-lycopersici 26381]
MGRGLGQRNGRRCLSESHGTRATTGLREEETVVIGNSRRGHANWTMGWGIDDITPCSLPPTGERNSYHNGCSETGRGVEQTLPSSRSKNRKTKVKVPPRGIKLDEIQLMTKKS